MSFSYYVDNRLPFPHVVDVMIDNKEASDDFPGFCREIFESMGRQFMMSHEYVYGKSNFSTKYVLYLETEDMAMWLRLTYG